MPRRGESRVLSSHPPTFGVPAITFGPGHSARIAGLLDRLQGREGGVLEHATHTHLVLGQPYRTPFTFLLTFIGHKTGSSVFTVPHRAWRKWRHHDVDIPTIGYLPHLHTGILADAMERAAVVASVGKRAANVFMSPFSGPELRGANRGVIRELEDLCGLSAEDRRRGWGLQLLAQVGQVADPFPIERSLARKLGAPVVAAQRADSAGVNMEDKAPGLPGSAGDVGTRRACRDGGTRGLQCWGPLDGCGARCGQVMMVMERVDAHGRWQGASAPDSGELGDITDHRSTTCPGPTCQRGGCCPGTPPAAARPSPWPDSASTSADWTGAT